MENHTFRTDTKKSVKKNFLKKNNNAISFALLLTGLTSVGGVVSTITGILGQVWNEMGVAEFVKTEFYYLSIICIFISLIKIVIDEKPFSRTLSSCMRIIAMLSVVGSALFPRLPGYNSSGFTVLMLFDGYILMFGVILYLFSILIEEGFKMQKELDEIL